MSIKAHFLSQQKGRTRGKGTSPIQQEASEQDGTNPMSAEGNKLPLLVWMPSAGVNLSLTESWSRNISLGHHNTDTISRWDWWFYWRNEKHLAQIHLKDISRAHIHVSKLVAGWASVLYVCLAYYKVWIISCQDSGRPAFKLIFNLFLGLHSDVGAWWSSWPIKICKSCFLLRALFHCFIQSLKWRWWSLNLD